MVTPATVKPHSARTQLGLRCLRALLSRQGSAPRPAGADLEEGAKGGFGCSPGVEEARYVLGVTLGLHGEGQLIAVLGEHQDLVLVACHADGDKIGAKHALVDLFAVAGQEVLVDGVLGDGLVVLQLLGKEKVEPEEVDELASGVDLGLDDGLGLAQQYGRDGG